MSLHEKTSSKTIPFPLIHKKMRRKKEHGPSFNRLVPNILTMLGLCSGLISMYLSMDGYYQEAVIALIISAFIDGLDGRIARILRGTSRFGAEFDSLSDFFCFGIAPTFLIYLWSIKDANRYMALPCLIFAVCMALRLARFNANLDGSASKPKYAGNFFKGVPAPAGAGLALFPVFVGLEAQKLHQDWLYHFSLSPWLSDFTLTATAFLLVSTVPVWSFKNFRVPAHYVIPLMLGIGVYAAFLVADTWAALAAAGIIYTILLPLSYRSFLKLQRAAEDFKHKEKAPSPSHKE